MSKKRRHSQSNKNTNTYNRANANNANASAESGSVNAAEFLSNARKSLEEIQANIGKEPQEAYVPILENGEDAKKPSSVSMAGASITQTATLPVDVIKEAVGVIYDDRAEEEPIKKTFQREIPKPSKYEEPPTFGDNVLGVLKVCGEFILKHKRYFIAGVLFAGIAVIVGLTTRLKDNNMAVAVPTDDELVDEVNPDEIDIMAGVRLPYEEDAYPAINALVTAYYEAYANADTDAVEKCAIPVSDTEKSYIALVGQFVESYNNIKCYTKKGIKDGDYLVSAYIDMKFDGIPTYAPGLDFFYITTSDTGTMFIDNAYSHFNQSNMEISTQPDIMSVIKEFDNQEDVIALKDQVQAVYDAALLDDAELNEMVTSTLPNAISAWVAALTDADDEPTVETIMGKAKSNVNIRSGRGTGYDRIGKLEEGQDVEIVKDTNENGWIMVVYNGENGFVMTDYLEYDDAGTDGGEATGDASTDEGEGRKMTVNDTLNIRSMMTTDSDLMGTTEPGDEITVILDYAEGWTKVKWKEKTGYIKTDILYS